MFVARSAGASRKCAVCGDSPAKIHYGQLACFGCKGFFRRAVKDGRNKYVCRFEKNCQINKNDRNACRYCRFRRCLLVGMNPDFVRPDRDEAKQKLHKTLSKKKSLGRLNSSIPSSSGDDWLSQMPSSLRKLLNDLSTLETQLQCLGETNYDGVAHFSLSSLIADRSLARKTGGSSSLCTPPSPELVCIDRVVSTIDFIDGFLCVLEAGSPSRRPSVEDKCSLISDCFLPLALIDSAARLVARESTNYGEDLARTIPCKNLNFSFFCRFTNLCESFKKRGPSPTEYSLMRALLVCCADATQLSNSLGQLLSSSRESLQELMFRVGKQHRSSCGSAVGTSETVALLFQARELAHQLHAVLSPLYPPTRLPQPFAFYLVYSDIFHPQISDLVAQVLDSRSNLGEQFVAPKSPLPTVSIQPPPPTPPQTAFTAPLPRPRTIDFSPKLPLTITKSIEDMLRAPGTMEDLNGPLASDWADGVRLTPVFNRDVVAQFFPELCTTNQLL